MRLWFRKFCKSSKVYSEKSRKKKFRRMDDNFSLQPVDRILATKDVNCLQEEIKDTDQCLKQTPQSDRVDGDDLAKMTVNDGVVDGYSDNTETCGISRSEVVLDEKWLQQEYGSVAQSQQYISLTDQLRNMPEPGFDQHSSVLTPLKKVGLPNGRQQGDSFDTFCSFDSGSPEQSLQAASESWSSSLDAESVNELSTNTCCSRLGNGDCDYLPLAESVPGTLAIGMKGNLEVAGEGDGDDTLKEMECDSYYELLDKVANYERELRIANQKLLSSEEEIARLKQEHICVLEGKLMEEEIKTQVMRHQIEEHESEKLVMKISHEEREKHFLAIIQQLQDDLSMSRERLSSVNQSLNANQHKLGILMAEKDQCIANLQTLNAELRCREIQNQETQAWLDQLTAERVHMVARLDTAQKVVEELRHIVTKLEKQVDKERVVSLERAEEKREAIRQLCFSMEYYRREYNELRKAVIELKNLG